MIIAIYGKSGSGKTFLADKLASDLPNAIHIDLDEINRELMLTDDVVAEANKIFKNTNVLSTQQLDANLILNAIMHDEQMYTDWTNFMKSLCTNFVINYIDNTNYDIYIIDHLNAGILNLNNSTIYIECMLDKDARMQRLNQQNFVSEEILDFRDSKYISHPPTLVYNNTNYEDILQYISQLYNTK